MSIFKKAWAWLTGAAKKLQQALTSGKDIANSIKQVVDSPLLDVAVKLTKTDLDDKALQLLRNGLSRLIEGLGWSEKKLSDFSDADRTYVLSTLAAEASVLIAYNKGVDLNRQQAITASQLVYDEKKVLGS